ncbi:MAG TPA: GspH/FimT family pseudopilin, partial [Lysobacter sp.]
MERREHGFTLAELATALAVLAVILLLGLPAFSALLRSMRTDTAFHAVTTSLASARLTAISRQVAVTVCPSLDGRGCRKDLTWDEGWIVFPDPARTGRPASEDVVLHRVAPNLDGIAMHGTAGRQYVRYLPNGFSSGSNLTLYLCSRESGLELGEVKVNNGGRVR